MSRASSARQNAWLANQISTARRNLSEWPEWMKDAANFQIATKPSNANTVTNRPRANQRIRKAK
jgi:hypothetical protein